MISEARDWSSPHKYSSFWLELALDDNDEDNYQNGQGQDPYGK